MIPLLKVMYHALSRFCNGSKKNNQFSNSANRVITKSFVQYLDRIMESQHPVERLDYNYTEALIRHPSLCQQAAYTSRWKWSH